MSRTTVYTLVVVALVTGFTLGYVGATLFGAAGADRIRNAKLEIGDKAPDFQLRDHTGRIIKLSDYVGEKNVVLAFLPGAFTPV
jgi:hypothetical protein